MTLQKLNKLCKKYNVPDNVLLQSDSGWECNETEMDGPYYNKKENIIIFTQYFSEYEKYERDEYKKNWTRLEE
jgi:hypothetical protein